MSVQRRCQGPCGKLKNEDEFYIKRRKRRNGSFQVTRQAYCKECSREYQRSEMYRKRDNERRRTPDYRADRRIVENDQRRAAGIKQRGPYKIDDGYRENIGRGAEEKIDASEFRKWLRTKDLQIVAKNSGVSRSRLNGYANRRGPEFDVVTLTFVDKVATANGTALKLIYPDA
jgi:hypothetical protein